MAYIKQRYNKWEARVRVPQGLVQTVGKTHLYHTLKSNNKRAAQIEAQAWETSLKAGWAAALGHDTEALKGIRRERAEYERVRVLASQGRFRVEIANEDPALAGIDFEIEKLADKAEVEELSSIDEARLAALNDASLHLQGLEVPKRRELEPTFSELSGEYVRWWKAKQGLKPTNTEQQKKATFNLFAGYWGDRPIRKVRQSDAARFLDALRLMDPSWARSKSAKDMSWEHLQRTFGGRERGLSDATLNRHATTLQALWEWAVERDYSEGRNPFQGFRTRLRQGVNVQGYVAWETDELKKLFAPPPKRNDVTEVILVGMFTGMRLDEIASLRGQQVREEDGVAFVQVVDAKTPAGNRQVPLHPAIGWLKARAEQAGAERIWSSFNPEGPGKKAGADAGREFSRFKRSRGFLDRRKAFHSFRKNVTRIMERERVPENEWAQVFGHEKGFTYGRYNPDGITLAQKSDIIARISYPGVSLPQPVVATERAHG